MAPDGSRLARETLAVDHPISASSPLNSEKIKGQLVEVLDAANGQVALEAPASPALDAGGNVAISPSGRRVAVLNAGTSRVPAWALSGGPGALLLLRFRVRVRVRERSFAAVILGDPLAFNVRFKTGSATAQLALFLRLRVANGANKIQGKIRHPHFIRFSKINYWSIWDIPRLVPAIHN
jgi:hypothetical protein